MSRARRVTVRFYRAHPGARAMRSDPDWHWPTGEIGPELAGAFLGASDRDGWPLTERWNVTYLVEVTSERSPCEISVSSVRDDQLPFLLKSGAVRGEPLDIGERDALLEPTYLIFMPNNVVALVRGPQTPGATACARALAQLTGIDLDLLPIPQAEILGMVTNGWGVSSFDFRVAGGSLDANADNEDLVAAADDLRNGVDPAFDVKITISAESPVQQRKLRSRVIRFLNRHGTADVESAHAFVKSDENSKMVDLLETQITTQVEVTQEGRFRYLTPSDALEAAQEAFEDVQVDLTRALQLAGPVELPDTDTPDS